MKSVLLLTALNKLQMYLRYMYVCILLHVSHTRSVSWVGYVAYMGKKISEYVSLVGKSEKWDRL